ncbi:hypothetical protein HPB51_003059 [Rhipicephalus microplus]|uniref:Uncharacterized protein n=1 Tax=Rhipicephalus microplus TaxID=6941 RepID=A0A9J6D8I5_RHIMP|nr:hypothetical protein HPB51_003059 [Rhipicephalus microplus]
MECALEKQVEANTKEQKDLQSQLEHWKSQERDWQERINDDAKDLEKMTSRQSVLLKKVSGIRSVALSMAVKFLLPLY